MTNLKPKKMKNYFLFFWKNIKILFRDFYIKKDYRRRNRKCILHKCSKTFISFSEMKKKSKFDISQEICNYEHVNYIYYNNVIVKKIKMPTEGRKVWIN